MLILWRYKRQKFKNFVQGVDKININIVDPQNIKTINFQTALKNK